MEEPNEVALLDVLQSKLQKKKTATISRSVITKFMVNILRAY